MKPSEKITQDYKMFKLGVYVLVFCVVFYFINSPKGEAVHQKGVIQSCKNYQFLREVGKELTVKLDTGETRVFKHHKCEPEQMISIAMQKRLITRQHVYFIEYR